MRGSSPRTRRTLFFGSVDVPANRFIPAHAENTKRSTLASLSSTVHPRARGEHNELPHFARFLLGSSPRTRRTHRRPRREVGRIRFIPAHAENTVGRGAGAGAVTVHPRARGEHKGKGNKKRVVYGSSPRTRRTQNVASQHANCKRFIPAHAENTLSSKPTTTEESVHPRARGEHPRAQNVGHVARGSSPRTRRTRFHLKHR